ncbi:MAG: hypothetical protein J7L82_02990 [Staphylothermus sp.]|nr:hypothetical protein [Staphylothermus sp.]
MSDLHNIKYRIMGNLERAFPGLIFRLDWFFLMDTGKGFVDNFLSDPIFTYRKIVEYFNGDEESAKYTVYVIMREVFSHRYDLMDKAYKCIIENDYKCIDDILKLIMNKK